MYFSVSYLSWDFKLRKIFNVERFYFWFYKSKTDNNGHLVWSTHLEVLCFVYFTLKKKCIQQLNVRIIVLRVKRQNLDPNFTCNLLSSSAFFRGVTKAVSRTSDGKPREGAAEGEKDGQGD